MEARKPKGSLRSVLIAERKANDHARLNGPLIFEPHNLAGGKFEGEEMPFGYISTSRTPMPIFELSTFPLYDADELAALAKRMAAANELLEMLTLALPILEGANAKCTNDTAFIKRVRAVIAKAKG